MAFFAVYVVPHVLHFCGGFVYLLCVILLFKMAPKHSAEEPCGIPKHKKAIMYLLEKISVLGKTCSCMSAVPLV